MFLKVPFAYETWYYAIGILVLRKQYNCLLPPTKATKLGADLYLTGNLVFTSLILKLEARKDLKSRKRVSGRVKKSLGKVIITNRSVGRKVVATYIT